ncbi:unnamed protein product, partial [Allacma fusca]
MDFSWQTVFPLKCYVYLRHPTESISGSVKCGSLVMSDEDTDSSSVDYAIGVTIPPAYLRVFKTTPEVNIFRSQSDWSMQVSKAAGECLLTTNLET